MMPEEKMQENLNVFLHSSFFVPLLKRMTGQKDELSDEGAGKYQEISREMQREEEKKQEELRLKKERSLQEAMLSVKKKYGKNAMLKGMNLQEGATAMERNSQIGGHKA